MGAIGDIPNKQVSRAALRLARAFQGLLEDCTEDFRSEMPEQIVHLSNQISQVDRKQEQSLHHFESIRQSFENMVSANNLLEKASEMSLILGRQHYDEHIIEPMVRSLFPVLDIIADSQKHHDYSGSNATALIDSIHSQLSQFLANYNVEIVEHSSGDSFDPKSMKPISWETTDQPRLENSIARSLQIGFRLGQTRILRMETVTLFKYQPSQIKTMKSDERTEQ